MPASFRNTAVSLIGYPGVGKYTIAKEIARQSDFILVDNHLINNPVFTLLKPDGVKPLPSEVWSYVGKIRNVVLDAIENIAPRDHNFVLTNVVFENEEDRSKYEEIVAMFTRRDSLFVPVILSCDVNEHEKRITGNDRRERMKEIDPAKPAYYVAEVELIHLTHPNLLRLDVTDMDPADSARMILAHAEKILLKPKTSRPEMKL